MRETVLDRRGFLNLACLGLTTAACAAPAAVVAPEAAALTGPLVASLPAIARHLGLVVIDGRIESGAEWAGTHLAQALKTLSGMGLTAHRAARSPHHVHVPGVAVVASHPASSSGVLAYAHERGVGYLPGPVALATTGVAVAVGRRYRSQYAQSGPCPEDLATVTANLLDVQRQLLLPRAGAAGAAHMRFDRSGDFWYTNLIGHRVTVAYRVNARAGTARARVTVGTVGASFDTGVPLILVSKSAVIA